MLRYFQGLLVVFQGVVGLEVVIAVPKGTAEFVGDGFGVGGEFGNDVILIDVVCIEKEAGGRDDAEGCKDDGNWVVTVELTSGSVKGFMTSLGLCQLRQW